MESIQLRPRKPTEIVDAAIEVYRRNPLNFILLTSIVQVPWLILQILIVGDSKDAAAVFSSLLISLGARVCYFIMSGLIVYMASELYLGREIDAFETIRRMWKRLPAIFAASFLKSMAVGLALIFLLVPAVWVSAHYFAAIAVLVLEQRGVSKSFDRSGQLSNGHKMHILGTLSILLLIWLIMWAGGGFISAFMPGAALQQIVVAVTQIVVYPIIAITETLLYYDIRIRKEGFDIEMMAGAQPATAAEPAPVLPLI